MKKERVPPGESSELFILLSSIGHILTGHKVQWYTDDQKVTHIINRGSTKPDLQTLAEEIVNFVQPSQGFSHPNLGPTG